MSPRSKIRFLQSLAARCAEFIPTMVFISVLGGPLASQTTWQPSPAPLMLDAFYGYDAARDRIVLFDGNVTYEGAVYQGMRSYSVATLGGPGFAAGVAYAPNLGRLVIHDGLWTREWDGQAWLVRATPPPLLSFWHLVTHERRGTVLAFGGPSPGISNDLYEWDGTTWNLIPTTNRPPRPAMTAAELRYMSAAYDARRDKIVLFGSAVFDHGSSIHYNFQPVVWEWDETTGWTNPTIGWPMPDAEWVNVVFDSQRGVLSAFKGRSPVYFQAEWDGGPSWQPVTAVSIPQVGLYVGPSYTYDPVLGRAVFSMLDPCCGGFWDGWEYGTVNTAQFSTIGPGCAGTRGEPTLRLTRNWTRAWLGRTLSIDVVNLPQSSGFLAYGLSTTASGPFTLPLDLTPYGLPGCAARVAFDAVVPLLGTNQVATDTVAIPNVSALLGCALWQQAFAIDPPANLAGLTASNAIRLTVGRL